MPRLKRRDGKVVGRLVVYGSTRSPTFVFPKSGSYYQTHPPKTMKWGAVQLYEETGRPQQHKPMPHKKRGRHWAYLKPSTIRKLHLV